MRDTHTQKIGLHHIFKNRTLILIDSYHMTCTLCAYSIYSCCVCIICVVEHFHRHLILHSLAEIKNRMLQPISFHPSHSFYTVSLLPILCFVVFGYIRRVFSCQIQYTTDDCLIASTTKPKKKQHTTTKKPCGHGVMFTCGWQFPPFFFLCCSLHFLFRPVCVCVSKL